MDLEKLEVRNHRSIKEQWGDGAIEFEGLDCLVGKNNVGKTNIISSIKYLLEEEDKTKDEELYWNKETSRRVEVRGYFEVLEEDLDRIRDEDKREQVRELLLDWEDFDNHLGICRITEPEEEGGSTSFQVIQLRPVDEDLSEDTFLEFRDEQWNKTNEEDGFTGTDYRGAMQKEYPEVAESVDEDSLTQKKAWKTGYEAYIDSRPDGLEFEPRPTSFPSGTKNLIRDVVLPDVVKIPAIKEVEDAAQASGELGEMTDALYSELEEDINEQLDDNLGGVYDQLDASSEAFEEQISDYLKEAFRDYSVELDFPRVESRRLFRGVDIRIEDDQLEDTLSHENVGEGVRRVLVFSMLRTIADLRDNSLSVDNEEEDDKKSQRQPLLILYEEAELFLHPNLQKNMLRVFRSLCNSEAQIIFNTHSPVLVQNRVIDTINIVRNDSGTEVTPFHTVLEKRGIRERSRLMDLQKISSYIFSDRVLLVEGQSDEIVLNKVASILNPNWIFQSQNIPILELGGKDDFPLFKAFLEELGIEVFVMADIGALSRNVPQIVDDEDLSNKINGLKGKAGQIGENGWKQPIIDNPEQLNSIRSEVRTKLLKENILVLMGEVEDYYPDVEAGNKIEAALEFSATDYDISELQDHFVKLPDRDVSDVEAFLGKVFDT
jgi:predicted ATP-dependent endonuclease of OLD family